MAKIGVKAIVNVMAFILAMGTVAAQSGSSATSGALKPFAESLRSHGIEISEPSLISALRNGDPEVRSLAALKLAEDHHFGATPSIEAALSVERVPSARIGLASALWTLQDPKGADHLRSMCSDSSLSIYVIVDVVRSLNVINESSAPCAGFILSYLDTHKDSESRSVALWAFSSMYRWVPRGDADRMAAMLQEMLRAQDPSVRLGASHALVEIGQHSFAQAISDAMSKEQYPNVRASLQRDLAVLEKKP
jgi:HEAT repeat protein